MKNILKLTYHMLLLITLNSCSGLPVATKKFEKISSRKTSSVEQFKYIFYQSWDQVKTDYDTHFAKRRGKALIREENYSSYNRIEEIVASTLNAYKTVFPGLNDKMRGNTIWVIIYESERFSAFASKDSSSESSHVYLAFSKKVLDSSNNALTGVIAHEMAHILLQRYSTVESRNIPIEFYYDLSKAFLKGILSENTPFDLELQKKMKVWEEYASWAGEYSTTLYRGVGLTYNYGTSDFLYIIYLYLQEKNCPNVKSYLYNIFDYEDWVGRNGGPVEVRIKLGRSDSLKILNQFGSFEKVVRECLGDEKVNIFELLQNHLLKKGRIESVEPIDQFERRILENLDSSLIKEFDKTAFDWLKNLPLKDAFFKIIFRARLRMREIESSINFNQTRRYTSEDHADEIAVKILKTLDVPFDDYYLSLGSINSTQKICVELPTNEPFSPINQKHHNQCWRYWRAGQLEF